MYIPVYGQLMLPAEIPLQQWSSLVRQTLFKAAGLDDATHLALKTGPHCAPLALSLLRPADALIYTIRHPAETVIGLTESVVDGMRPAEAVQYVELHLRQAAHLLATSAFPTLLVRLEDLVTQTEVSLAQLVNTTKLSNERDWQQAALAALPNDIYCSPRWDHPTVRPYRTELAALGDAWGYA
ncbi:hypothetical protein [Saccharothrix sp. Mg75]|uniref:hypothetical protein n=1 Tax=Saccharothrix sp. Mg75 TaxID=3445357 RepID=UPI003EEB100B